MRLSNVALSTVGLLALACGTGSSSGAGGSGTGGHATTGGGGAGGGAAVTNTRAQSGTRLKVRVVRAGDAVAFDRLFDEQLQEECSPQQDANGQLRCMPADTLQAVMYRDTACSDAIVAEAMLPLGCPGDPTPTHVTALSSDSSGCEPVYSARAYEVGSPLASPPTEIYTRDGDACVLTIIALEGTFYELTESPAALFVPLATTTESRGAELTAEYLTSDDGMRLLTQTPLDTARGASCLPLTLGTTLACAPITAFGFTPAYSDMGCTQTIGSGVVSYPTTCPKPDVVVAGPPIPQDLCAPELHAYEVGAASPPAFISYEGSCVPGGSPDAAFAALGAPIPDSDLPAFEYVDEGAGPVRLRAAHAGGGPLTQNGTWVTDVGSPCTPALFGDGAVRCGPPPIARVNGSFRLFADAACSQLVVPVPNNVCLPEGFVVDQVVVAGDGCAPIEVHELGAIHTGPVYGQDAVGCIEVPADPSVTFHLVGAAVPDSAFVELTQDTL